LYGEIRRANGQLKAIFENIKEIKRQKVTNYWRGNDEEKGSKEEQCRRRTQRNR
jgi:hypothetical protein